MSRLILVVFFFEVGFALIVVPWSTFWDRNYFSESIPTLHAILTNYFVRGAVSGLGVVNAAAGLMELVGIFAARRAVDAAASSASPSQAGQD